MGISAKGRYALRVMLDLAIYNTGEPVSVKDIVKRQEISEKYLEQIISSLNKAGFVKSIRGARGGYTLARSPKDYTVGMILRVTEGTLDMVNLDGCSDSIAAEKERACSTIRVWEKMNKAVNSTADAITLEDLVSWEMEQANEYVI
jgi:Rrf2 family protein